MARGLSWFLLAPLLAAGLLTGCRFGFDDGREPWRAEAEAQCIAAKGVAPSAFIEPLSAIDGPGACGMEHPFKVSALADGNVVVEPAAKLACPVIHEVDMWLQEVVQPAALAWLGQPIVAISQMSAYSCRGMNGQVTAKISEHAFGNALDVGAFRTADGRWITVRDGWKGPADARGFLLQVQAGACERFTTVLAPGSNAFHYDHIHVDLMRHEKGRMICKPAPRPVPAPLIAKAPLAAPAYEPPAAAPLATPATYEPDPVPPPRAAAAPRPAPDISSSPLPPPPAPVGARQAPPPAPSSGKSGAPANGLPPGWQVGPQGVPVSNAGGNLETGSVKRKYYTTPMPQPSTIPLPQAKPGED